MSLVCDVEAGAAAGLRFKRETLGPPLAYAGMRIGLLGGSFNPPHLGHRHIAETALRRLGLDQVWLIVTPGNPIKVHDDLAALSERLAATRRMMSHPRIKATGFEATLPSAYTARTLAFLQRRFPGTHFVWIMGGDNLASFHRWQEWRGIMRSLPVAVLDRPGFRFRAMASPAAMSFRPARVDEAQAGALALMPPPAWTYLSIPLADISSTQLRRQRGACANSSEAVED
jgi:nicotinate-nucleotide adenylyltransferase